jgi:hypothetical protein
MKKQTKARRLANVPQMITMTTWMIETIQLAAQLAKKTTTQKKTF